MKKRLWVLHKNLISAYFFFVLAALAYFCSKIYTIFTHGDTSETIPMVWLFLLIFGAGFRALAAVIFALLKRRPRKIASNLYDSGVIAYTAGMTMRGIFEIFGADRNMLSYYEFAGIGLMAVGFVLIAACSQKLSQQNTRADVFALFISQMTVNRVGARLETWELYALHNEWAQKNGYYPLSAKRFQAELKRHYNVMHSGIASNTVLGIALCDERF